jgi:trans-aconitate methyltransferase
MIGYVARILRHLFYERSYERYYSAAAWERRWAGGYGVAEGKEEERYDALLTLMCRYAGDGPILDAGCGDGVLEQAFRAVSPVRVVGIDYSLEAVERAKARQIPNCSFAQSDYREFMPAERFPLIVLNESLYYVEDFVGVLRSLSRCLTGDGVFIVSMFDTLVTRRIWKVVASTYETGASVEIQHRATGRRWRIQVLRPTPP